MAIHDVKKVNPGEISLELMRGQDFANAGQWDGKHET